MRDHHRRDRDARSVWSIADAGDAALLLTLDARIDPQVNARAIAIARAVESASLRGVRDVVATYCGVAVHVDPLAADVARVSDALLSAHDEAHHSVTGRRIEVPVVYGGDAGPDLARVAARAGLSGNEVIARHAAPTYRVYMLGFLPGFAYMGTVDPRIAAARLPSPRVRVPAGSVGVAGRQTGVYPRESPGGWALIGRTGMRLFDPASSAPAVFAAGDEVRFVRSRDAALPEPVAEARLNRPLRPAPARSCTVLEPGLLTTIQDEGRWGHQRDGVSPSGAMDRVAHRLANAAVGNNRDAATLEVTLGGPTLHFDTSATLAIAGADLGAALDSAAVPCGTPVRAAAGSVLRFTGRRRGARAYVAIDGGIDTPPVLRSRSTQAAAGLGGLEGRPLRSGDRVPLGQGSARPPRFVDSAHVPDGGAAVRVLAGPQGHALPASILTQLENTRFIIQPASDRRGFRLRGEPPLPRCEIAEMISDAAFVGGIQVPASGEPIVLMADRHTTGGYPQIATVITADLPLLAQLAPGDWVRFTVCSRADAIKALIAQETKILAVE